MACVFVKQIGAHRQAVVEKRGVKAYVECSCAFPLEVVRAQSEARSYHAFVVERIDVVVRKISCEPLVGAYALVAEHAER